MTPLYRDLLWVTRAEQAARRCSGDSSRAPGAPCCTAVPHRQKRTSATCERCQEAAALPGSAGRAGPRWPVLSGGSPAQPPTHHSAQSKDRIMTGTETAGCASRYAARSRCRNGSPFAGRAPRAFAKLRPRLTPSKEGLGSAADKLLQPPGNYWEHEAVFLTASLNASHRTPGAAGPAQAPSHSAAPARGGYEARARTGEHHSPSAASCLTAVPRRDHGTVPTQVTLQARPEEKHLRAEQSSAGIGSTAAQGLL